MKCNSILSALLVVIVVASVAVSSFAQTGEVYSLNVVGFQKLTASSGGTTMVSTPFDRTPNTLDNVIGNQLYGHKSSLYADNIYIYDAASQTYKNYTLKTDGKWYDFAGVAATNTAITSSIGFWIKNTRKLSNETVVVSGDVVDVAIMTNVILPGVNMVSYPFSTEVEINRSALTNGYGHKSSLYADNVFIWDSASQSYQNYTLKTDKKWYDFSGNLATNVKVGAGRGFWYRNRSGSNFSWVEMRPYTL